MYGFRGLADVSDTANPALQSPKSPLPEDHRVNTLRQPTVSTLFDTK